MKKKKEATKRKHEDLFRKGNNLVGKYVRDKKSKKRKVGRIKK